MPHPEETKTSRPRAEQSRRRTLDKWLDVAVKVADVGAWVWELNKGTREIIRNEPYNRFFGISSASTWTRDGWLEAIHPEDRETTSLKMQTVISGEKNEYNAEYRILRPDGTMVWVHAWGKNVRASSGKVIRVTGVIRDITDRKRVERDRDQFVATLSHDLRNPLSAVRTNAELIQRFPDRIEHQELLLGKIVSNVERADRMIQNLLDASRLQSGNGLSVTLDRCDLAEVVEKIVKELADLHGDRIQWRASGHFNGMWDVDGMTRVLENLVGNAMKYGAENAPVTVGLSQCEPPDHSVALSVHNRGNPIPLETQRTLFEPFHRATPAGAKKGWGLGLTVVRGIAEAHGGRVEVRSDGEGTTFIVRLPLLRD